MTFRQQAALCEHGQALEGVGEAEDQALRKGEPQVWRNLGRRGVVEGYVTQQERHYYQLRLDADPDNEADAVISVSADHLRQAESGARRKLAPSLPSLPLSLHLHFSSLPSLSQY